MSRKQSLIQLDGVRPSAEIRAELAADGRPVLLAFSRGKDSIATWLALRDAGVDVIPFHMYRIPGIAYEAENLAYFEDFFDTRIHRLPHPWLFNALNACIYQPPERCAVIDAANLPSFTYEQICHCLKDDLGLDEDTWVCEGVRACDSQVRRIAMKTHGPLRPNSGYKCSAIWDWRIADVRAAIDAAGIEWPPDYRWFGRSFDGIDLRFIGPLREHAPEDYEQVRRWFPLVDLLFFREDLRRVHEEAAAMKRSDESVQSHDSANPLAGVELPGTFEGNSEVVLDALQAGFRRRMTKENDRFRRAVDVQYWFAVCFDSQAQRNQFLDALDFRDEGQYVDGVELARRLDIDLA